MIKNNYQKILKYWIFHKWYFLPLFLIFYMFLLTIIAIVVDNHIVWIILTTLIFMPAFTILFFKTKKHKNLNKILMFFSFIGFLIFWSIYYLLFNRAYSDLMSFKYGGWASVLIWLFTLSFIIALMFIKSKKEWLKIHKSNWKLLLILTIFSFLVIDVFLISHYGLSIWIREIPISKWYYLFIIIPAIPFYLLINKMVKWINK